MSDFFEEITTTAVTVLDISTAHAQFNNGSNVVISVDDGFVSIEELVSDIIASSQLSSHHVDLLETITDIVLALNRLQLTSTQATLVFDFRNNITSAFSEGTEDTNSAEIVGPYPDFNLVPGLARAQIRNVFCNAFGVWLLSQNAFKAFPNGIAASTTLAPLTFEGIQGSLTFVDGILTAKTNPT